MVTFIDKGWCNEDDPIFTEGITVFTVRKTPADAEKQPEPRVLASIRKGESKEEFKERIKGALREAGILKDKKEGE
jgi:hypothetical protein